MLLMLHIEEDMKDIQHPLTQGILFLLALIGAGIALYLTTVHYEHVPLVCSTSGIVDCARVTSSAYSVIPSTNVPITVPGLLWAIASAVLAVAGWRMQNQDRRILLAQLVWSLLGLLAALYLVYVELVLLHTICAWCTGMHVVILIMFLISMVQFLNTSAEEDDEVEEESSSLSPASKS